MSLGSRLGVIITHRLQRTFPQRTDARHTLDRLPTTLGTTVFDTFASDTEGRAFALGSVTTTTNHSGRARNTAFQSKTSKRMRFRHLFYRGRIRTFGTWSAATTAHLLFGLIPPIHEKNHRRKQHKPNPHLFKSQKSRMRNLNIEIHHVIHTFGYTVNTEYQATCSKHTSLSWAIIEFVHPFSLGVGVWEVQLDTCIGIPSNIPNIPYLHMSGTCSHHVRRGS